MPTVDLAVIAAAAKQAGHGEAAFEHFGIPGRLFRFDIAWPLRMVAFEREGFAPKGQPGRHQRPDGYRGDCEKYNLAQIHGWLVVRATSRMIQDGTALNHLLEALASRRPQ